VTAIVTTVWAADFNIPGGDLEAALNAYSQQAGIRLMYSDMAVRGVHTKGVSGAISPEAALTKLLNGTGFTMERRATGAVTIVRNASSAEVEPQITDIQIAQAAPTHMPMVETVTVTSSKLGTTDVQSIPIAITALSQEQLAAQKIEGGPDLLRSVPNMTFTKTNFASYNVQIRGVGTQAVSASTDPGVAISFNDVGLIHNRLFEQEFFDVERVEVLRGPQGTLYGRNATGGVINVVSAKPNLDRVEGSVKAEVGNYASKRVVGMLNLPIVDEKLGLRFAGSITKRDGYDFNSETGNHINGRDLWSFRTTLGMEPAPWLHGNIVWEEFRENDNRSRTGKQLCHRDDSPDMIGSTATRQTNPAALYVKFQEARAALFSTGCKAGSLYDDGAFDTPNGLAIAFVSGAMQANGNIASAYSNGTAAFILNPSVDPYGGMTQSHDLREVASVRDPRYSANSDIMEFNFDVDLANGLTLSSQSGFDWDSVYSFQDYNRFNTVPIFNDTSDWVTFPGATGQPSPFSNMAPGGVFCDPQIGCTDRLAVFDVSSSASHQFSQEVRLRSSYSGSLNFSAGVNYTRFRTQDDYYVMSNLLTAIAMMGPFNFSGNQTTCSQTAWNNFSSGGGNSPIRNSLCPYIDPNPVESIDGDGHNYFRSSNPYDLSSYAAFGEAYYNLSPDVKLTAGLRYTRDQKAFTEIPSQLLLAPTMLAGGRTGTGYPSTGVMRLNWGEFTGRFGLDWQPVLDFTDRSLFYATYSRGYKAGGMNPPTPDFPTGEELLAYGAITQSLYDTYNGLGFFPLLKLTAVNYGPTFQPEFVNAYEIGTKNALLDGRLTFDASSFFYDYSNYQVSQIRDRTAVNENFDAKIWGTELSTQYEPIDNLRLNANIGYLGTRIGDGERSIDPMNRTLGNPNYTVAKPWVQLPSNCVIPTPVAESWLNSTSNATVTAAPLQGASSLCSGVGGITGILSPPIIDPATGQPYNPANYPELNGGAGLYTDLGGNELPNSPHWTINVGAEYTVPFADDWAATVRGDFYWQAQSWWRVYNLDPFDRLKAWTNVNFTVRVDGPNGLAIEAYVKNVFDKTSITGAFLNSDDSGLTTNVFTTDPRLIGFSVTKSF